MVFAIVMQKSVSIEKYRPIFDIQYENYFHVKNTPTKLNENVHHFCLSLSMTGRLANSIYDLRYTSLRAGIQYNQEFTSYSGQITKYSAFVFSQNGKFQRLRQYKRRCYYIASKICFCHKTFIFRYQLSMVKDGRTKNERLSR